MKKIIIIISAVTLLLSSCSTQSKTSAKFTSIEKVINLKLNSSLEETIETLGCSPYNLYSSQLNGYTVYEYKYKLVERTISPYKMNEIGSETDGKESYNPAEQKLFLFFKEGKLEAFVTQEGEGRSVPLVLLNNRIYSVSTDKGVLKLDVPATDTKSKSLPSLPGRKKK